MSTRDEYTVRRPGDRKPTRRGTFMVAVSGCFAHRAAEYVTITRGDFSATVTEVDGRWKAEPTTVELFPPPGWPPKWMSRLVRTLNEINQKETP